MSTTTVAIGPSAHPYGGATCHGCRCHHFTERFAGNPAMRGNLIHACGFGGKLRAIGNRADIHIRTPSWCPVDKPDADAKGGGS